MLNLTVLARQMTRVSGLGFRTYISNKVMTSDEELYKASTCETPNHKALNPEASHLRKAVARFRKQREITVESGPEDGG